MADHNHSHSAGGAKPVRALAIACALTTFVMVLQFVGGWWANSLALISDAGHMMTDAAALAIALIAIYFAKMKATPRLTFGFHRFEIFAAVVNALMLFAVAAYIMFEAWSRFNNPPTSDTKLTLVIATIGLVVNFVSMRLLQKSGTDNLNMKGAYLEVWSDMIGSLGVIVSAIVAYFTGWKWLDPVVAVLIALFVLPRAWTLLNESMSVLLEAVPQSVDSKKVTEAISSVQGVSQIHELHIWTLTSGKHCLTAHAVSSNVSEHPRVLAEIFEKMRAQFNITHICVQLETVACEGGQCSFDIENDDKADHRSDDRADKPAGEDHAGHNHV